MTPDEQLSIQLDAICARHQYEPDASAAIAELRDAAGDRLDVLNETVGTWVGYFEGEYTQLFCEQLIEAFPGGAAWVERGQVRRGPVHGTAGF